MSYAYIHSACVGCGDMISYHADHVPSLTVEGERCAICKDCFEEWNKIHRVDNGLEPVALHPKAYEPMEGM